MNRRQLLRILALQSLAAFVDSGASAVDATVGSAANLPPLEISRQAANLVRSNLVVDLLGLLTLDWRKLFRWQNEPASFHDDDARKLESSGINVFHPAVAPTETDQHAAAIHWLEGWNRLIEGHPCRLLRVDDITDLLVLPRAQQIGLILGFQNSSHFRSPEDVEAFFRLGQRISQLTYNDRNRLGSGCKDTEDQGITSLGAEVVAAMNEAGILIDLSHCGPRTTLDAIEASTAPVLFSHANCRSLVPWQPRNKSDEEIRQLARRGGVMGITTVRAFVGGLRPGLDDWLDHFDHVAELVGPQHLALGSDIDIDAVDPKGRPIAYYRIEGLRPAARAYQLAEGLLRRGYSENEVRGVLGDNVLRVVAAVWPQQIEGRSMSRDPFCPPLPGDLPPGIEIGEP